MGVLGGDRSTGAAGGDGPELDTATVVGISVAIAGNILISLALNLQKLAHKRIERERNKQRDEESGSRTPDTPSERPYSQHELDSVLVDSPTSHLPDERQPLIPFPHETGAYSATSSGQSTPITAHAVRHKPSHLARLLARRENRRSLVDAIAPFPDRDSPGHITQIPIDVVAEDDLPTHTHKKPSNGAPPRKSPPSPVADNETAYLKSKLWWTGFLLMNVGELGNFISYAWAPASVVAPLGTFALIANCFFAPLMIGERFRKRDLLGICIAVVGAVTVVLSTQSSDTRLNPDALIRAICKTSFAVYTIVYLVLGLIFVSLSPGRIGQKYVFIDVGLCALFGGFTVLSTKAVSTLLTMEWVNIFTHWITYVVILVLIITGVGQIRYLNRALMRFDSKVVIPMQFVLFNLSAIVGSAILYGDFERAKFHQIVTFLYGCGATFLGVFIIAWAGPGDNGDDQEREENGHGEDGEDGEDDEREWQGREGNGGGEADANELRNAIHRSPRGSVGRRRRPVLIVPSGNRDLPVLRRKQSIMGLSPAHPLLIVHTPPSEIPREWDFGPSHGSRSPPFNRSPTFDATTLPRIRETGQSRLRGDSLGARLQGSRLGGDGIAPSDATRADSPSNRTRRLRTMSWFEGEAAALRPREHSLTRQGEYDEGDASRENEGGSTLRGSISRKRGSSLSGERGKRSTERGKHSTSPSRSRTRGGSTGA